MVRAAALPLRHARVQRLRRLIGRRSARHGEGVFVIEGAKVLTEALDAAADIEGVYVATGTAHPVVERALAAGIRVFDLAEGVIEKVADTVTPQPVMAVVRQSPVSLGSLEAPLRRGGFVVVAVDVRDPGNAGTLIRTAVASGAAGVVLCAGSVEITNPKTLRASAGALFHVPVVAGDEPAAVLDELGHWGVRRLATVARRDDASNYDDAVLSGPLAVVMGNEAHGLPEGLDPFLDGYVTIPMAGPAESLNVSMAAAVVCFEAAAQRRRTGAVSRPGIDQGDAP